MKRNLVLGILSLLVLSGSTATASPAGIESVVGKWLGKAETPNGPIDFEFELKQEGGLLTGTATVMQSVVPMSAVKFEEPNLVAEFNLGGSSYKLLGALKEGKFSGGWEQVGSDMKGTWSADRKQAAPAATPAVGGIAGSWNTISNTPNGELALTMELNQDGDKLAGTLGSEMGTVQIQAASFKEGKLQYDVELGGTVYRVEGTLQGDKIEGKWYPVAGGEGGTWHATRKPTAQTVAGATQATAAIEGTWNSVAVSPEGNLSFQTVFKQSGGVLSGQVVTPDGSIAVQKLTFSDNKVSFEVDYMGGTYRLEGTLAGDKLTGRWSAVGGTETGSWSADRKP